MCIGIQSFSFIQTGIAAMNDRHPPGAVPMYVSSSRPNLSDGLS